MAAEEVHGLILGVEGHIHDHLIGIKAGKGGELLGILQIVDGSGINAVRRGEEDILTGIVGSVNFIVHLCEIDHAVSGAEGGGIDLHPALAIAAAGAGGIADHPSGEVLGSTTVLHLVADFVSGVVRHGDGNILTRGIIQGEGQRAKLTGLRLLRRTSHLDPVRIGE